MTMSRSGKMLQFINWKIRVTISDNRALVGIFLAFDKHMNIVLADCQEFRRVIPKGKKTAEAIEETRTLGLVLLRGEHVISITAETPPAHKPKGLVETAAPGSGRAAGRGLLPAVPLAQAPNFGAIRGVGGAPSTMVPQAPSQVQAPPVNFPGRGMPPPPMGMGQMGRGGPPMVPPGYPMVPPPHMMGGHPMMPPPHMMGRGVPPPMMPPMMGRGFPGAPPPQQ